MKEREDTNTEIENGNNKLYACLQYTKFCTIPIWLYPSEEICKQILNNDHYKSTQNIGIFILYLNSSHSYCFPKMRYYTTFSD